MKNILKITLSIFLLTLLFVNVITSKDNKSEQSFIGNLIMFNSANAEGGGDLVNCNCGLLWGKKCRADNYGATCSSGDDCTKGDKNCD